MGTQLKRGDGACLVCGKPLTYLNSARKMKCAICGQEFESFASCEDGHYVCDACHRKKGLDVIMQECLSSDETDPIAIMQHIMENPFIYMHGPEHHVLVGAALLTAWKNCGGKLPEGLSLSDCLQEMQKRGSQYPGGSCGFWGCCGAAASCGMFMSIVTSATPLTQENWGVSNQITGKALERIGAVGGPRCCKRDSFLAAQASADFLSGTFGVNLNMPEHIRCTFSHENHECIGNACPFNPIHF